MSYCQYEVNAQHVDAKHVRAKEVKTKKLHACEATLEHLHAKKVKAPSAEFTDVVVTNTLTLPAMGLIWSDVAQVTELPPASGPEAAAARDVAAAEEPAAMVLDFMVPVTAPTAVAGKLHVGAPTEAPVEGVAAQNDDEESDSDESEEDLVVEHSVRIKGDLFLEGKLRRKNGQSISTLSSSSSSTHSTSCSDCSCCTSSSQSTCSSSLCGCGCDCSHELEELKSRLAALEALVASHHP